MKCELCGKKNSFTASRSATDKKHYCTNPVCAAYGSYLPMRVGIVARIREANATKREAYAHRVAVAAQKEARFHRTVRSATICYFEYFHEGNEENE